MLYIGAIGEVVNRMEVGGLEYIQFSFVSFALSSQGSTPIQHFTAHLSGVQL